MHLNLNFIDKSVYIYSFCYVRVRKMNDCKYLRILKQLYSYNKCPHRYLSGCCSSLSYVCILGYKIGGLPVRKI